MFPMEFVWVVPRAALLSEDLHGFLPLDKAEMESRFLAPARKEGFFMERRYAETHPEFKQPIPYVAVCKGDQVFCLTRLSAQGEKRLHGKRSIGVGGHINPCDQPESEQGDVFAQACERELQEELLLPEGAHLPLTPLGVLNDDTTEVGSVHIGIVYHLDAQDLEVAIRETDAMAGDFESHDTLQALAASNEAPFETWSALLLQSGALTAGSLTSSF